MTAGSQPTATKERKTPSTSQPWASARARVMSSTADAPSDTCDELPAVLVPDLRVV